MRRRASRCCGASCSRRRGRRPLYLQQRFEYPTAARGARAGAARHRQRLHRRLRRSVHGCAAAAARIGRAARTLELERCRCRRRCGRVLGDAGLAAGAVAAARTTSCASAPRRRSARRHRSGRRRASATAVTRIGAHAKPARASSCNPADSVMQFSPSGFDHFARLRYCAGRTAPGRRGADSGVAFRRHRPIRDADHSSAAPRALILPAGRLGVLGSMAASSSNTANARKHSGAHRQVLHHQ